MKILYFHGFGARLNGFKASSLRAHFGQDSVFEPAEPGFPYCNEYAWGNLRKLIDRLKDQPLSTLKLLGRNRQAQLVRLSPEMVDFFRQSVDVAQRLYDAVEPDVIVGSSLGGGVAMAMDSGDTPMLLVDPVWNRQLQRGFLEDKIPNAGPAAKALMSCVMSIFRDPVADYAGFEVPGKIKPATIILHSHRDDYFDVSQSFRLLKNNPIPADDPPFAQMNEVIRDLREAGYSNHPCDSPARFNDGRLIIIGKNHHNNEVDPDDRLNRDPDPHRAMNYVVALLARVFGESAASIV